ncbi:MAG: hypothetical protein LW772_00485 [Bacteroidetes bacterium]|jgi:hypothetical protein|nr:hypothetical protein [Bacteroidota bacterium]
MKLRSFLVASFLVLGVSNAKAQGCVAVRGFGGCGVAGGSGLALAPKQWQVGANYRYFESFRHFKGDEEQYDRLVKQTQVINYSNTMDISASMGLTLRTQLNVNLPVSYTDRSSYYEHGGQTTTFPGARKTSTSAGIGDARIGISKWLWNPVSHTKSNLMLGVGLKLPTGNWNVQDSFYNVMVTDPVTGTSSRKTVYRPVDQSIQLGDGGLGLSLEMQGFWEMADGLFAYGNAFYILNPRGVNGTMTNRRTTIVVNGVSQVFTNEYMCSVADQYAARLGFLSQSQLHGLSFSWGARLEGVPVRDLVGESYGFRRPGYTIAAEPGVTYMKGKTTVNFNMPIALYRIRKQSVTDKEVQDATGVARNGDAAFADYLISLGVTYRLDAPKPKGILPK